MCLSCGYRGRHIQGQRGLITFQCPSCGEDLYARPPRSYAEMEGFLPSSCAHDPLLRRTITVPLGPAAKTPTSRWRALEAALVWSLGLTFGLAASGGILAALL